MTTVLDKAKSLVSVATSASKSILRSNLNEVVSNLDNLKRLLTHTSEVEVPVLGYQIVGNKLEVEISYDGVAKALGNNINKAVKDLANAIRNFKFVGNGILGAQAATAANAAILALKQIAAETISKIGDAASLIGKLGNYTASADFFGHIKAEIPITISQEKVVSNSKGYVVPVEFRGIITTGSPINLVFEPNKGNNEKAATVYFKGQKPISSWIPNTKLITITESSTPNIYEGITNLPDGFTITVTDNNIKLDQLKARKEMYNIPVKVSGPGLDKDVTLQVKVNPNYKKWQPKVTPVEVIKGETPDLPGAIKNIPDGAKANVTKGVDPNQPGEQTGQVTVTFPDGSKKVVDIPVKVKAPVAEPSNPTEPGNPVEPGTPTEPGNPVEPGTPTEPGNPVEPGTPTEPGNPVEPSNPTEPGKPGEPSKPTEPGKPGEPGTPTEPGNPVEPGKPGEPSNPTEPGNPVEPSKPTDPGKRVEPGGSAADKDALPFNSSVKNDGEKKNTQPKANSGETGKVRGTNKQEKELPKTGENYQSKTIAMVGTLVAAISGIGLVKLRKSKKENKS